MSTEDLGFVVDQHLYHFPNGFFARLGPRFLREYYRAFLTSSCGCSTIAEVDGRRAGYLVGVCDPIRHRDHVVHRHGRALVQRALAAMLRHPLLGIQFLHTRSGLYLRKLLRRPHSHSHPTASTSAAPGAPAVLSHVAVVPQAQGHGIGAELITWFDHEAACAGCGRLALVTASGEDGAGPYYRRTGWKAVGERRTPDGMHLTTFERPVEADPDHDDTAREPDTE